MGSPVNEGLSVPLSEARLNSARFPDASAVAAGFALPGVNLFPKSTKAVESVAQSLGFSGEGFSESSFQSCGRSALLVDMTDPSAGNNSLPTWGTVLSVGNRSITEGTAFVGTTSNILMCGSAQRLSCFCFPGIELSLHDSVTLTGCVFESFPAQYLDATPCVRNQSCFLQCTRSPSHT